MFSFFPKRVISRSDRICCSIVIVLGYCWSNVINILAFRLPNSLKQTGYVYFQNCVSCDALQLDMLVITSELYAELILFPAPIQAGGVLMHSLCMDSAHHEGQPAGICERRWSPKTWPSQVRKYLLPSEDLPEICLILLLPQGCQGRQWKWERVASSWACPVGSGSLQKSSCWAKMLCESLALLSWKLRGASHQYQWGPGQDKRQHVLRLLKIAN